MSTAYENALTDPPLSQWSGIHRTLSDGRLQTWRILARRRLVQSAEQFVSRLREIGDQSGLTVEPRQLLGGDPDSTPIVMTGHQPVIFHSGLTFKYETTESFSASVGAIAVAVIIDTDEGDAGAFPFPDTSEKSGQHSGSSMVTSAATFGRAPSLYLACRKNPGALIQAESQRVIRGLKSCDCGDAAAMFQQAASQYEALATDSMMEANLIVRWNAGIGGRMLELPLSEICGFPEVIQFFGEILTRPSDFTRCYNDTLMAFRTEEKIRNEANPFPNLQVTDERCEIPFWIIDRNTATRSPVFVRRQGQGHTLETADEVISELPPGNESAAIFSLLIVGKQLIPRGALITATLRLLFSDLFVHGTGGGRYDRYTDLLIRRWWNTEPTPFAVASASRYLFADRRVELSRIQAIASQLRDLQFNPQRHFGTGVFSPVFEDALRQKVVAKESAVARLRSARESGESARETGHEIQQLGDEIKSMVAAEFESQLIVLRATSEETIATLKNRLWPWLFFGSEKTVPVSPSQLEQEKR